jgi:hypothetical protein
VVGQKRRIRRLVGGVCVVVAVVILAWPGAAPDPHPDGPLPRVLAPAGPPGEDLDAALAVSRARVALQSAAINDLIAGRLTLAAAVTRFQEVDRQHPDRGGSIRRSVETTFPTGTYEESLAHSILSYCEARLLHQPNQAGPVLARLRGELAAFTKARKSPPHRLH